MMADDLKIWLEQNELMTDDQKNTSVLIVALIGKEVADNTKADLLNAYLGKQVFLDRWIYDEQKLSMECGGDETTNLTPLDLSIDIYFDPNESIVWLKLNDANDVAIQHELFAKNRTQSFFEKMATVEQHQLKALAMLFHLSHAILLLDQGCRFDLDWIGLFKRLNRLRPKLCKQIRHYLSPYSEEKLDTFSRGLIENGRIASPPKLLFCYHRNPLRSDLNAIKKKELLEKMEKCLESQISNLLKQHGLLDNRFPENTLGEITIASGAPFVYCFNNSEVPIDQTHELAMALFGPNEDVHYGGVTKQQNFCSNMDEVQHIISAITEPKEMDKEKLDPSDYNFHYFLHKALSNMRNGGRRSKTLPSQPMDLPTLSQFMEAAKIVRKCVLEEWPEEAPKATPELDTIESLIDAAIGSAGAIYTRQLAMQPEVTGGGDPVFSSIEHEYALKMALECLARCSPRAAGSARREKMTNRLKEQCQLIWLDGHQRCERRSMTGQLCHHNINHSPELIVGSGTSSREGSGSRLRGRSAGRNQQQQKRMMVGGHSTATHCSGVKTFAMCNCGLSRRIRLDPFSLKEANFDFYAENDSTFGSCCAHLDKYEFKLFDPSSSVQMPNIAPPPPTSAVSDRLFKLLAPGATKMKEKTSHIEADELVGTSLGMDPSEFNVRFFDNASGEDGNGEVEEEEDGPSRKEEGVEEASQPSGSPLRRVEGGQASQEEVDEEEEAEQFTRRISNNLLTDNSSGGEEEEEEPEGRAQEEERGPPLTNSPSLRLSSSECSPGPEIGHYLDEYDSHLTRTAAGSSVEEHNFLGNEQHQRKLIQDPKSLEKFKGHYLEHVPHTSTPDHLLPLFPSFSVVCMGHSSVYNHSTGIRGREGGTRFRNGSEFLLPCSVELLVNTERWVRELQYIGANPSERTMRNLQQGIQRGRAESKEKVKLFIGFDYECPRGHHFMVGDVGKPLRHRRSSGLLKEDASTLLNTDLPIWMLCPCRKEPRTNAQLMRIHVITPKAPVSVRLQPMVQVPEDENGFFFPGAMEGIELGWAKYYVCRLPYVYVGPSGRPTYPPLSQNAAQNRGLLLRQCISVAHLPIH